MSVYDFSLHLLLSSRVHVYENNFSRVVAIGYFLFKCTDTKFNFPLHRLAYQNRSKKKMNSNFCLK